MSITNKDYRESGITMYDYKVNCPFPFVIQRLQQVFKTFEYFLNEFDFMASEFPLDPKDYTDGNWEEIGDWLSDVQSEQAEASVFRTCPQSVDPIGH